MPDSIRLALDAADLRVEDVDVVVAHQANERILAGVRKQLGVDEKLVPSNIDHWGNTTAGTLPILFHEQWEDGRIESGSVACFAAFGAGAHWGAMLYRHPSVPSSGGQAAL